jgi:signal transduction histidine kinase
VDKRLADSIAISAAAGAFGLALLNYVLGWQWSGYAQPAMLALAGAMLLVGAAWLHRRRAGSPFRELALPASVATVLPLVLVTTNLAPAGLGIWLLASVVAGTLGVRLAGWLAPERRGPALAAAAVLAAAAGLLGVIRPTGAAWELLAMIALAAATALPGVMVAVTHHLDRPRQATSAHGVASLELGVVGLTPAIAVMTTAAYSVYGPNPAGVIPLIAWILVVLVVQYVAVGPMSQTAATATTQRDLVVAAMEAERSRIAADIHDDALQELTLLAWKLDSSGQGEGAATAREIADRLRAITGDLRLPILDDLGTGPALEWLVERVGRLTEGEVRLERGDQVRPPADVELAFFRVAQEALSNAVRHGKPPIVVRYWTSPSGASLSVDDAGGGFDPVRVEAGEGHFGLLNMRQRAEQVGALLDVRRWPQGGTQVALEWRSP